MDLATRDACLAFADMICHDPQWLAAEFDELVSANFSEPPVPRPPAPPKVPPCPGTPPPSLDLSQSRLRSPARPAGRATAGSAHPRARSSAGRRPRLSGQPGGCVPDLDGH